MIQYDTLFSLSITLATIEAFIVPSDAIKNGLAVSTTRRVPQYDCMTQQSPPLASEVALEGSSKDPPNPRVATAMVQPKLRRTARR